MAAPKTTPMLKQYLAIKDQYPDAILFYRMGDFYEMFFEDAQVASKILEITLTSRNKNDTSPVPMCGVPYRAVRGYIARMIERGYKVALCDQVEDPAQAKGLVKRDVVRIVTPGMIVEDELLDKGSHNYILALHRQADVIGLAYLDISTATFRLTQSDDLPAIVDEILRIAPREVILPECSRQADGDYRPLQAAVAQIPTTLLEDRYFDPADSRRRLLEQFQTLSLEGFGCEELENAVAAAGALIHYVGATQKQKIEHLNGLETYHLNRYLWIDDLSCRNLELLKNLNSGQRRGSLLGVIDGTVTAMGARLLKSWLRYPLMDPQAINARLEAVAEGKERLHTRGQLRDILKTVSDLERIGSKVAMGHANARDLTALKTSLLGLPDIDRLLAEFKADLFGWGGSHPIELQDLARHIDRAIREDAPLTITEGGIIRQGYHSRLDELISLSRDSKSWLVQLEQREKEATGITTLKVRFNKVFGYYLEVPKARSAEVPPHFVRKQTLVNAERYITDELKTFETRALGAEEQRTALEYELFNRIRQEIVAHNRTLQAVAAFLARLDCLLNLAEIADRNDYTRPDINTESRTAVQDGRHPVVEKTIAGERFVPNTLELDNTDNQVLVITGPNMAGKSTVLRQVALMTVMAQMGSFVPARQADIGITDRIFTRVGALDNLSSGQSTFMVEMQETANILNNATERSLVIMDEIGRGTSTFDGLSIAWAVVEYLHDLKGKGVKTLFATHYHELTELATKKQRVKNYNIAVKEWNDEIIFLRKLVAGGTNRSYGIQVARLAGIPAGVIRRAKKILAVIEAQERNSNGGPLGLSDDPGASRGHIQMNLFQSPESRIVQQLHQLDISRMTPLEALNCLSELQAKVCTLEG